MKKIITIIPASGTGSRFGSEKPKQLNFINHEISLSNKGFLGFKMDQIIASTAKMPAKTNNAKSQL